MQSGIKMASEKGAMHLPMLFAVLIMATAGFGTWGILRHWRFLVEAQFQVNRCVGQTAHDLRDILNSLRQGNHQIRKLRLAILAAHLKPELIPPLKTALNLVVAQQDFHQLKWKTIQAKWFVARGCGNLRDQVTPIPGLPLKRDPPDQIGPLPLDWVGLKKIFIEMRHAPRSAAAYVRPGTSQVLEFYENEDSGEWDRSPWISEWAQPLVFQRSRKGPGAF
jgi:hypothetical protein